MTAEATENVEPGSGGAGETHPLSLGYQIEGSSVSLDLDEKVYPIDAVYGAAYLFVDRCFVFLSRPAAEVVRVRLTLREPGRTEFLEAHAGEFANELLNQVLRLRLAQSTARIREYYTAAALKASNAAPSIDDLLAQLESEEVQEDPLEILVPWEQKYGKGGGAEAPVAPDGPAAEPSAKSQDDGPRGEAIPEGKRGQGDE